MLEQELRALAGERTERKLSVVDAKVSRRKLTSVAATVDAYATRLVALLDPHPDPRAFVPEGSEATIVPVIAKIDGPLEIGTELFNQGEVLAGDACVARAGSMLAAQFVRGVLLLEPELSQVEVPKGSMLDASIKEWTAESRRWHQKFKAAADRHLAEIERKTREQIEERAIQLLHAR